MIHVKSPHLKTITVRFYANALTAAAKYDHSYASLKKLDSLERFDVHLGLSEDRLHLEQEMQSLDLILVKFVPSTPGLRSVTVFAPEANWKMTDQEQCLPHTRRARPGILHTVSL